MCCRHCVAYFDRIQNEMRECLFVDTLFHEKHVTKMGYKTRQTGFTTIKTENQNRFNKQIVEKCKCTIFGETNKEKLNIASASKKKKIR